MSKPRAAVFDVKPYDRDSLVAAQRGENIDWSFHSFRLDPSTAAAVKDVDVGCVFVNDRADETALHTLAEAGVRHLALRCAGYNNVDLSAAKEHGICVTRVPSYSPHAVAEHTLALLLTLNRRIHRAYNRVRELNFSLHGLVGMDLHGKTAGVIGTGRTGALVAQIFRGFGMRVCAHDPYPNEEWAARYEVAYKPIESVFTDADIVSLHLPLTPDTRHLVNEHRLGLMKPGAILLNVSRGALVDTGALIKALKARKLGGVGLDVYEEEEGIFFEDLSNEMLDDDELARLLTFPNVLITSHQAFLTREALSEIARVTTENILRVHRKEPPLEDTEL